VCAPKGCAFLYARRDVQDRLDPLVVSWGWEPRNPGPSRFVDRHEWQGSRDVSMFLVVPEALAFQAEHGWDDVRARCKLLARHAQREVCALAGTEPWHPDVPGWYGQIVCAPLPPATDEKRLLLQLRSEYEIDVSADRFEDRPRVRISIQGYNDENDVDHLLFALRRLL
jgi:isopenicillin-N epimerase